MYQNCKRHLLKNWTILTNIEWPQALFSIQGGISKNQFLANTNLQGDDGEWRCQVKVLEVCCNLETAPLNKRLLSELKPSYQSWKSSYQSWKLTAANEGQSTSAWNSIYNNFSLFTRNPSIVHLLTFDQNVGGLSQISQKKKWNTREKPTLSI